MITAIGLSASVARAEDRPAFPETSATYQIAAQDLDAAISAYVRTSKVQVFFETAITAGRRSMPLDGQFTPAQALKMLLAGTGLSASRTDVDAFVIAPAQDRGSEAAVSTARPERRFLAALQTGVLDALCRDPRTRPGSYRVGVELWITPGGIIQQSSLIGSTGDAERDRALLSNLRGASIAAAPPTNVPQPFIMMIRQRAQRDTGDCAG